MKSIPGALNRVLLYAVAIFFAVLFLMPVYVMVNASITSFETVAVSTMWRPPDVFSLKGFATAWVGDPLQGFTGLGPYFLNSLIITIPAVVVSVFLGSINGYVLPKWKFRGSNFLFMAILFGMFI